MRLIDGDVLYEKFKNKKSDTEEEREFNQIGRYLVRQAPTIDLIEYGEWIFRCLAGEDPYECSICGNSVNVHRYSFCPHCGADMRMEYKNEV